MIDIQKFTKLRPYLYHLTDQRNIDNILQQQVLYSTKALVEDSNLGDKKKQFLTNRRADHTSFEVDGKEIWIRDQKPIGEKVVARSLEDGMAVEDYIEMLNERVFFWPTLKDLQSHFGRYENEKPQIIRLSTEKVFALNPSPRFCRLNSGAPRCSSHHGGNPAPRGFNLFQSPSEYATLPSTVREVTFLDQVQLPSLIEISETPDGEWVRI